MATQKYPVPEVRVIGAGLGRSGTFSVKEALEILGFGPCHHMAELPGKVSRCMAFVRAYHGKPTNWRSLMSGWGATVDHPNADFVPELMAAYPDAKVILTVRDNTEVWWKSYSDTIYQFHKLWNGWVLFSVPSMWAFWLVARNIHSFETKTYGTIGPATYEMHNEGIKRMVPKDKLLVFNVKEGWEPLCKFLGVDVPKRPFPRNNETKEMHRRFLIMRSTGVAAWVLELGLLGLVTHQAIKRGWFSVFDLRRLFG
ncbi:hypothetical protein DACRYDRAFT_103708 [Dacryopinax primogenitus]|uniref:P-loop containing nucleoside triphosphate hydrolase protein n=1 Tax=Dacryopinax primogenitus (strain DJM 731) TaxID=1858805 RepID=M5G915_DACPD|nr:uncharacterized protein DACRYDRAFT_103708 [Dacryopinax primogenitus]EJU05214.1 hypothetical protein DACRYDRAFT_103708 [Dacryopinax primogenitus]